MDTQATPYREQYPAGSIVRIKPTEQLEEFKRSWKFHHPISSEQISYGGRQARVEGVTFYHGGDALYKLENTPGIWHEVLLEAVPT